MANLFCGAAKGKITPPQELIGELRGLMDRHFGGVLDDLFLRVIALKSGEESQLLITFDLDKVPCPARYLKALSSCTGVPENNILLAAVHTHTAPIAGNRVNEGPNNLLNKPPQVQEATHRYEDFIEKVLTCTALEAVEKMVPARMGVGQGKSYINVDRKQRYETVEEDGSLHGKYAIGQNFEAAIDHTAYLIRFEDFDSNPLAFFINYPVHCCVLNGYGAFDGDLGISGDIAGRVCAWNEEQYPGAVTLWTSGAAGDINPVIMYQLSYPDPKTGRMAHLEPTGDFYNVLTYLAARHYDDIKKINRRLICSEDNVLLGSEVTVSETDGNFEPFKIRLHMMRLGDTYLLGASGELYDVFAKDVRKMIPARELIVINHDASQLGDGSYIVDDVTLCLHKPMLPGLMHANQKPSLFEPSFLALSRAMYEKLDPRSIDHDPGPMGPGSKPGAGPMGGPGRGEKHDR